MALSAKGRRPSGGYPCRVGLFQPGEGAGRTACV